MMRKIQSSPQLQSLLRSLLSVQCFTLFSFVNVVVVLLMVHVSPAPVCWVNNDQQQQHQQHNRANVVQAYVVVVLPKQLLLQKQRQYKHQHHHHQYQQQQQRNSIVQKPYRSSFGMTPTILYAAAAAAAARSTKVVTAKVYASTAVALVPLFPEPPGGIELQPINDDSSSNTNSIGVSRLKQLDMVVPPIGLKASNANANTAEAFQFWMTTYSDGKAIQEIRQTILKDASKKANFPGFRKGQVPPYAQPQITQFAIQESIIKTVEAMVRQYGLESVAGSDGQVQVHEDVSDMTKLYKMGTSIQFTATLNAHYTEIAQLQLRQQKENVESNDTDKIIDVKTTTITNTTDDAVEITTTNMDDDSLGSNKIIDMASPPPTATIVLTDPVVDNNINDNNNNSNDNNNNVSDKR